MMFEGLAEKLQNAFYKLRNRGSLTEDDVNQALREIRISLLEADVNYKVVKDFIAGVREKAVGSEILTGLNPAQQVIKIVYDELTGILGGSVSRINMSPNPPTVIMMCGLQGAGKTTTCAKLACMLRKEGKKPLMVAADVYRPAAAQQLKVLGRQVDIPVFDIPDCKDAVKVCRDSLHRARMDMLDTVILDVAGRLHIDEPMMNELRNIRAAVSISEVLLVVDAMTGQDAVNVARSFNDALNIDGVVLTKLDGDARGGAAISIKAVTGKPIKLVGTSEKMDGLEKFHPDRMASRIIGQGDVLTFIEQTQEAFDEEQAKKLEQKIRKNTFDLNDFLEQLRKIQKMGPLENLLAMIPGIGQQLKDVEIDPRRLRRVEAIICSMTQEERRDPDILNGSRRRRIAAGSGATVQDVNTLIHQFTEIKKMVRKIASRPDNGKRRRMPF
ncbi:MAG: signal recognition particle protein [Abditibacteriota bacterium]|nr:signal recognition particle protein [Abditibacteriota bacterium]